MIGWGIGEREAGYIVTFFVQLFGVFLCSFEGLCFSFLVLVLAAFVATFYKISFLLIKTKNIYSLEKLLCVEIL